MSLLSAKMECVGEHAQVLYSMMLEKSQLEPQVFNMLLIVVTICLGLIVAKLLVGKSKKTGCYVADFAVAHPDDKWKSPHQVTFEKMAQANFFNDEVLVFQGKMLERAGLGDETYAPPCIHEMKPSRAGAYEELGISVIPPIDELLARQKISAKDIDFLVVNCSLFCPTPSISAWIVNHYKMPSKVRTFQIGGMGCSASMIGVDLIQELLRVHPDKKALLISTENISMNWYEGNEYSMVLQNVLFRMGGAAILLTGRKTKSSRYELKHLVRTHHGRIQNSFDCVVQKPDAEGNIGVHLTKDVPKAAGKAIEDNIGILGRQVLPLSEKLKFAWYNMVLPKLGRKTTMYTPNFRKAIDNFCIHTGGRAVIDTVQKNLSLTDRDVEASRATLYRYGNTSSSSVWYEMAYAENHRMIKPGNMIWQIAFGSGFKANSAVWRALPGCKKNRHLFVKNQPQWKYDPTKEGFGKPPALKFAPKYQKIIEAHRKRKAAAEKH
ncbi:Very-long-chain 3-ketoacyl-CoA synthase [Carpediemonas membranifera]|uniref:3-ketoacyl-CoA synthase n=1 Tax=Carpediemonas membranifera TaxID=201153 RepID=A0A8J6B963_9EUKA|nr:Very-long-chain 3-ketoacyl-CoA synthase [Carpediemonas membranifera]|eukprot:KAG9396814.1 Very-long-chain 3-ketoacyl-CoA synthase [Carpediemonas membranifera]